MLGIHSRLASILYICNQTKHGPYILVRKTNVKRKLIKYHELMLQASVCVCVRARARARMGGGWVEGVTYDENLF